MRRLALLLTMVLVMSVGCESMEPDPGDSGDGSITPGGTDDPGEDPSQTGGAPSLPGDGPEFPDDSPAAHNLNGLWEDGGREVRITQSGNALTGLYVEPHTCDHADGTGQTSETDLDFNGSIDGDTITGELSVCRFGFDDGSNGFVPAPLEMTVNPDDTELSGTWYNNVDDRNESITITRLGCMEKSADDYGLPPGNFVTSEYNANRVYRKDGSIQTVSDDYVLNPETDKFVRRHRGVDFSSRDDMGAVAEVDFSAGVSGVAAIVPNSDWNTINVTLPNGNVVQYLHASEIYVTNGQQVSPDTVLGRTGNTGADAIHLHVQARDASGNYINPSCAEE